MRELPARVGRAWFLAAILSSGCTKHYVDIRVRDPDRVALQTRRGEQWTAVLPADGVAQSSPLNRDPDGPRATATREHQAITISWPDAPQPLDIIDAQGRLPQTPKGPGLEVKDG